MFTRMDLRSAVALLLLVGPSATAGCSSKCDSELSTLRDQNEKLTSTLDMIVAAVATLSARVDLLESKGETHEERTESSSAPWLLPSGRHLDVVTTTNASWNATHDNLHTRVDQSSVTTQSVTTATLTASGDVLAGAGAAKLNGSCIVLDRGLDSQETLCANDIAALKAATTETIITSFAQLSERAFESAAYSIRPDPSLPTRRLQYDVADGCVQLKVKDDIASWVWLTYEPNSCGSAGCPCTGMGGNAPNGLYYTITATSGTLPQAEGTFTINYVDEDGAEIDSEWLNAFFIDTVSYRSSSFSLVHNDVEAQSLSLFFASGRTGSVAMNDDISSCPIAAVSYDAAAESAINGIVTSMWGTFISNGDPAGCQFSFAQGSLWVKLRTVGTASNPFTSMAELTAGATTEYSTYYIQPTSGVATHRLQYAASDGRVQLKVKDDIASWVWLTYEPNSCGSAGCSCTGMEGNAAGGLYTTLSTTPGNPLSQAAATFVINYVDEDGAEIDVDWLTALFPGPVSYRSNSFSLVHNDVEGQRVVLGLAAGGTTSVGMYDDISSCPIAAVNYDAAVTSAIGGDIVTSIYGTFIVDGPDPSGCQFSFQQGSLWLK